MQYSGQCLVTCGLSNDIVSDLGDVEVFCKSKGNALCSFVTHRIFIVESLGVHNNRGYTKVNCNISFKQ